MSSRKKKLVSQCNNCGCFFLAKGFEEHVGLANPASTPRIAAAKNDVGTVSKSTQSRIASSLSSVTKSSCMRTSFSESYVQMVEPRRGMVAVGQSIEKRSSFLPPETLGWQKYHTALVNPETLYQMEFLPRSVAVVVICSPSAESVRTFSKAKLFTLWPCSEVPHLRINLPDGVESCAGNLIRVYVVSSFTTVDSIVLVPSNLSELPSHFLQQISGPSSYFSTYLRVYLSQAFASPEIPIEVFYYGKKLVFNVKNSECSRQSETVEEAFKNLKIETLSPPIYRISFDANFTICWEVEDLR